MNKRCWIFAAVIAVAFGPAEALAQDTGEVTGTVVNRSTGQPLSGVQVFVPGTQLGTLTAQDGTFRIPNVSAGEREVRASLLGYRAQTEEVSVAAGQTVSLDIQLAQSAVALDEIVVTGTAGRQDRRAQGASISSVDAASITQVAPVSSVTDLLQGRSAGVSITQSSGTSGTGQRIRLRGAASIGLSNNPLVIIDGVRADARVGTAGGFGVGGQVTTRLNDVAPEDIESIEIIKGPAAATLYGADASAGVIQIITKRGQQGSGFSQNVSLEYNTIEHTWLPPANFGACSEALVAEDSTNPLCRGQAVGSVVSDNPAERYGIFDRGQLQSLSWSGRGGGETFGYYLSLNNDEEQGALPNNAYSRLSTRMNFDWVPRENLRIEAGFGLGRTRADLPDNDNNIYGFLGGTMLGSPLSVGGPADGWFGANRQVEALSAIDNVNTAVRTTPRLNFVYTPFDWFENRVTVGMDLTRTEARRFFPLNQNGWYGTADLNSGSMSQARANRDEITIDYLGNVSRGLTSDIDANLSFGAQFIDTRIDRTTANGTGFTTNFARSINAAAQTTGGQTFSESKRIGFLGQLDLAFRDRLYLEMGGRVDQFSAFGRDVPPFFSPKVGLSYVISDEGFWPDQGLLSTLRLRTAYGMSGNAPGGTAALTTFDSAPFIALTGGVGSGVIQRNPGNPNLRPERGIEYELGFDAGLFDERLGLDVTYFNKVSRDLVLDRRLPPSLGFGTLTVNFPAVNIGEVVNRGLEFGANARLIETAPFGWEARVSFSTLHNEVIDLGDIPPFGESVRVNEGFSVNYRNTRLVKGFGEREIEGDDGEMVSQRFAIVSDTLEFAGHSTPTFEGNVNSTFTFFRNLRLHTQLDWMSNFVIFNNSDQFRERQLGTGERWVRRDDILSEEERLSRFGPFVTESGANVGAASVNDVYFENGDFVRLREIALSYTLPAGLTQRAGVSGATITLAGRNLALWTDYQGADPEVLSANTTHSRTEFFTEPPVRRIVARLNLQF